MKDEKQVREKYADILELPYHGSAKRPHMAMAKRAAQFLPFAALDGYEETLEEAVRTVEEQYSAKDRTGDEEGD